LPNLSNAHAVCVCRCYIYGVLLPALWVQPTMELCNRQDTSAIAASACACGRCGSVHLPKVERAHTLRVWQQCCTKALYSSLQKEGEIHQTCTEDSY
jgi:hypothetical protein